MIARSACFSVCMAVCCAAGATDAARPDIIYAEAMKGEFGEIIRAQAVLEKVCNVPFFASFLDESSQKALAPHMPSLRKMNHKDWKDIVVAIRERFLVYQAGYAEGVMAVLGSDARGELCLNTIKKSKRWTTTNADS